jgi:His-Xaa-Ser system radical SAM maturase HxsC
MIQLKFNCDFKTTASPFVGKLSCASSPQALINTKDDSEIQCFYDDKKKGYLCRSVEHEFFIFCSADYSFDGDIFLFIPEHQLANRIIRRNSKHNTILFTEQCDERCVMCSQPPREVDDRWLVSLYAEAIILADEGVRIGISGGEPTLYKEELFNLLEQSAEKRPDLSFHILTNAQHFKLEDRERLKNLHNKIEILWGVPLYSSIGSEHDEIVNKLGAFDSLIENLYILASSGGAIELRTVLMKKNFTGLPFLAKFLTNNCRFIAFWAIMSIEPTGYAKSSRDELFFDHSQFFVPVGNAIDIAKLHHIRVALYNFPLCSVPSAYRNHCVDSISDWKKKYLKVCDPCKEKDNCAGFFEWYNPKWELSGVAPILNNT